MKLELKPKSFWFQITCFSFCHCLLVNSDSSSFKWNLVLLLCKVWNVISVVHAVPHISWHQSWKSTPSEHPQSMNPTPVPLCRCSFPPLGLVAASFLQITIFAPSVRWSHSWFPLFYIILITLCVPFLPSPSFLPSFHKWIIVCSFM